MYALLMHDFEFLSQFMAQCKYYRKIHYLTREFRMQDFIQLCDSVQNVGKLQLFESKCETVA